MSSPAGESPGNPPNQETVGQTIMKFAMGAVAIGAAVEVVALAQHFLPNIISPLGP